MTSSPTLSQYGDFQSAYEHFNMILFDGMLPDVMLTLGRSRHANGYVIPEGFQPMEAGAAAVSEISLNPQTFVSRTAEEILSTLVHEMVHLAQYLDGKAPSDGYHNRDWARRMHAVGLHPSSTGQPGGDETGQRMTHYIVEGGAFQNAAGELIDAGWSLHYFAPEVTVEETARKVQRSSSKSKYTCEHCRANAWGKPGLALMHGCDDGVVGIMRPVNGGDND